VVLSYKKGASNPFSVIHLYFILKRGKDWDWKLKYLLRDIARLTPNQWLTLISLLVLLNMVVVGGLLWIIASDFVPQDVQFKQVVLAQALHTRTPYPTFTPIPPALPIPGSPLQPTSTGTRVPTWTPTITPTPLPTDTPTITPTPTETPIPPRRSVANTPTPTPTPTPNVDYMAKVRQLTPCENQGKHHIFIFVVDRNGKGIPGVRIKVVWPGGESIVVTGAKIDDPGLADFAMFKGKYFVEVVDGTSEVVGPITPDIPRDELCPDNGNPVANSLFHYSYEIIFTKVR
jgi:hypothetical protein